MASFDLDAIPLQVNPCCLTETDSLSDKVANIVIGERTGCAAANSVCDLPACLAFENELLRSDQLNFAVIGDSDMNV